MTGGDEAAAARTERVWQLVRAARRIADPADSLGREARAVLPAATGLSPEGVEVALCRCLETHPADAEVAALVRSVAEAPRAHVLLSANVFVAAHRAIALALGASAHVFVRPSRREPEMTRLLAAGAPGLFTIVQELAPLPGDHVFAYGSDETMVSVRRGIGEGVTLHAHGAGIGVVVVAVDESPAAELSRIADAIAEDVVLFDQRGCLSPRVVLACGGEAAARSLAERLARSLGRAEAVVPRGVFVAAEAAASARYRDTMRYSGELFAAGSGYVGFDARGEHVLVPPVGRHVQVIVVEDLTRAAASLAGLVVAVASVGPPELSAAALLSFPGARPSVLGRLQRPPFDGPVDRRKTLPPAIRTAGDADPVPVVFCKDSA